MAHLPLKFRWHLKNELRQALALNEVINHEEIKDVVAAADAMLRALDKFRDKATNKMMSSVETKLDELQKSLEDMAINPANYAAAPNMTRKVTLKLRAEPRSFKRAKSNNKPPEKKEEPTPPPAPAPEK